MNYVPKFSRRVRFVEAIETLPSIHLLIAESYLRPPKALFGTTSEGASRG